MFTFIPKLNELMNILYTYNPSTVHDVKWMSYFSRNDGNNIYATCLKDDVKYINASHSEQLKNTNINLLQSIHAFSLGRFFKTMLSVLKLRKYIRTYNIDIIHFLSSCPNALWGLFINKPYIITTRGSEVLIEINKLKNSRGIKNRIWFYLYKKAFAGAKKVTSTSYEQVDEIKKMFGVTSVLIRTGVDVDIISSVKDNRLLTEELKNSKFVFSPRWIHPLYNTELQVDSIGLVGDNIKNKYYFVFIKYRDWVEDYVEMIERKLKKLNVKYLILNDIPQAEMWCYFNNASLTMMTPLSDGTPNTALEAMSARCPLIIGNLNYDRDLFDGTCIKLSENTPEKLAEAIKNALNDYPEELLNNAYGKVLISGNRKVEMRKLLTIYESLMNR